MWNFETQNHRAVTYECRACEMRGELDASKREGMWISPPVIKLLSENDSVYVSVDVPARAYMYV